MFFINKMTPPMRLSMTNSLNQDNYKRVFVNVNLSSLDIIKFECNSISYCNFCVKTHAIMANKICDIRPVDLNMVNEVSFYLF